jgi:hypothetical protein
MPVDTGRITHRPEMHKRVSWKQPCVVATTGGIIISSGLNPGDVIDGYTLGVGDRVLVKDQSTGSENGIYCVGATPARDFDMDSNDEVVGALIYVIAGTVNGGKVFRCTNTTAGVLGTTAIAFAEFATAAAPITADYLVGTAQAGLSAEIVVGTTPGGELGGTWASPTVDATHSGSAHSAFLTKVAGGGDTVHAHGNAGATETIDPALGNVHTLTLDANCTITLTAPASGPMCTLELYLTQDGTGARTVTWPGSVVWPGGVAPTLSTDPAAVDRFVLETRDGGTTWYGAQVGGGSVTPSSVRDAGRWEVVMDPATSSPPVPVETVDGLDWVYGWVT